MKLIDDLISDLSNVDTDAKIRDVHVGYTWIGVLSRNCGVAKNLGERHDYMVRNIGKLTEKTASELAEYLKSWNMIEAGIGLAAVNSMIAPRGKELNVTDFLLENAKRGSAGHGSRTPDPTGRYRCDNEFDDREQVNRAVTGVKPGVHDRSWSEHADVRGSLRLRRGHDRRNTGYRRGEDDGEDRAGRWQGEAV